MLVDADGGTRRPMRTRSRYVKLHRLFPSGVDKQLNARIARLCVLYEDLRIEVTGLLIPQRNGVDERCSCAEFDAGGFMNRALYFLRRSICTSSEFAEAIRMLNAAPGFKELVSGLPTANQREWCRAVEYFSSKEGLWKKIRNDVGGHFGNAAAVYAVTHGQPDASGRIELQMTNGGKEGAVLGFASEIAATALLRHLPSERPEEKPRALFEEVQTAFRYAVRAVEYVVAVYLWKRSG